MRFAWLKTLLAWEGAQGDRVIEAVRSQTEAAKNLTRVSGEQTRDLKRLMDREDVIGPLHDETLRTAIRGRH